MQNKKCKKPRSLRRRFVIFFIIFALFFTGIIVYFDNVVYPAVVSLSESRVKSLTTQSINKAVGDCLGGINVYGELIDIKMDNEGNVSSILTHSVQINKLSQELIDTSLINIGEIGNQGLDLPLGNFTGIALLAGRGPDIKIKIIPIGSITANFISIFQSAGINQTNHKIYINLTASVNLMLPIRAKKVTVEHEVLIAESVIVGKVPDTYLNSKTLGEMFNLIP